MRRLRLVALMLLVAALAPTGLGQEPPAHINPAAIYRLTDATADHSITRGPLIVASVNQDAFRDIDVLEVTLYEDAGASGADPPRLVLGVRVAGDILAGTNFSVAFTVAKGPGSLPDSTSSGKAFQINATSASAQGVEGATATASGATLAVSFPRAALGAVGGDQLLNLSVTTRRNNAGSLPVAQDDQSATDSAPDAGQTAAPFTLSRPAPTGSVALRLAAFGPGPRGTTNLTLNSDADPVPYLVVLTNQGLDPDNVTLQVSVSPALARPPPTAQQIAQLAPGANRTLAGNLSLAGAAEGTYNITFTAMSALGGLATVNARIVLDLPDAAVPKPPREVTPARLNFLTPAAEGLGFDSLFGSFAEAALLALLVLLAILAVFLLLFLGRSTVVGEAAGAAPPLAKPKASATAGAATSAKEAKPEPAPAAPTAKPLAIESVMHDPAEPAEGEEVETTVVLRGAAKSAQVRVVLLVGGTELAEQQTVVPARSAKTVRLQWTAGPGDNRIRVQVFPL